MKLLYFIMTYHYFARCERKSIHIHDAHLDYMFSVRSVLCALCSQQSSHTCRSVLCRSAADVLLCLSGNIRIVFSAAAAAAAASLLSFALCYLFCCFFVR